MYPVLMFQRMNRILLLLLVCSPSIVSAKGFSFGAGTDFTTGKYGGAASTDIWYVPFTARYDKDRASFRVIIPYLNITGPGNVLGPGIGGIDGRGTIIGGGAVGGGSTIGGGIVVCDEASEDCSGENPGRNEDNSGSGGSGSDDGDDDNSGNGGGDDDDDDNSGSGGGDDDGGNSGNGGGDDDGGNSGNGGGDDDGGNSGNGGGDDDGGNSGSGGGNDDGGNSGSGGGNDDNRDNNGDSEDDTPLRQSKVAALALVGGIPIGTEPGLRSTTQSGLGDIVTAFSYNMFDHAPTGIAFDITARLKIPTASAKRNLGTGQIDYAIQGDLYKTMSKFIFSATFGYRILGNPSGLTFHNVLYGAAGVAYRMSDSVTLGTSYNMGQSPVRLEDSRDLSLYLSQRVSNHFRLNIYGLRGFSDRSPDWGGGINLRYVF
ncbi:hypothetical protein ABF87_00265 [Nitrosomonas sp. JL21]|nr:hypothetical protein [Nitrosomonas sp. JL21]